MMKLLKFAWCLLILCGGFVHGKDYEKSEPTKKRSARVQKYLETGRERKTEIIYTRGGGWIAGSKTGAGKASFAIKFKKWAEFELAFAAVEYQVCK